MTTPKPLDVWDNLLIRACKSNSYSRYRLKRIWSKRCNISTDYVKMQYIAEHLIKIIEEYNLSSLSKFIKKVQEYVYWDNRFGGISDPILSAAVTTIALAKVRDIPDYHAPLCFRPKK